MLATALSLYQAFMDGIKKEYSGTVPIEMFLRIWNEWGQVEWTSKNVSMIEGIELTQKQIDDLQPLRRRHVYNPVAVNEFMLPDSVIQDENGVVMDRYFRLLNTMFKVDYDTSIDQECKLSGISDWIEAKILRSDMRSYILSSVYRKPKDNRLFYEIINNVIYMVTDSITGSNSSKMRLEYLTYPREINYDPGTTPVTDIPSVLHDFQNKEIVECCVELYLERVRDPRWQTYLQSTEMAAVSKI